MNYAIFKLHFKTPVHFGQGSLEDSSYNLYADTIFSALTIEALKNNCFDEFINYINNNELAISDALPFIKDYLFLPKPMVKIESKDSDDPTERKKYKKLKYINVDLFDDFLKGCLDFSKNDLSNIGSSFVLTKASIQAQETTPYHVGCFKFNKDSGLYIIAQFNNDEVFNLLTLLIKSLSFSGIGGKKNSGFGKFDLSIIEQSDINKKLLNLLTNTDSKQNMLISCAMTSSAKELENLLQNASYLLIKRSGFVFSHEKSYETFRKKDKYLFTQGSCFTTRFKGELLDVSPRTDKKVFKYAKSMFVSF